jgi:hypothetical protein
MRLISTVGVTQLNTARVLIAPGAMDVLGAPPFKMIAARVAVSRPGGPTTQIVVVLTCA